MTKWWNYNILVQIVYSHLWYTGRHFLGCALFDACCNVTRATWETKKESRLSYRKKYIEEFVWGTSLFSLHALLSMSLFMLFFVYSLPLSKWRTCWMVPIKIHNIAMEGILMISWAWWYHEWTVQNTKISTISCILILAGCHL